MTQSGSTLLSVSTSSLFDTESLTSTAETAPPLTVLSASILALLKIHSLHDWPGDPFKDLMRPGKLSHMKVTTAFPRHWNKILTPRDCSVSVIELPHHGFHPHLHCALCPECSPTPMFTRLHPSSPLGLSSNVSSSQKPYLSPQFKVIVKTNISKCFSRYQALSDFMDKMHTVSQERNEIASIIIIISTAQ